MRFWKTESTIVISLKNAALQDSDHKIDLEGKYRTCYHVKKCNKEIGVSHRDQRLIRESINHKSQTIHGTHS